MSRTARLKLILFILLVVGFFAVKQFTPAGDVMTVEHLRGLIEPMGVWGAVLFVAAFILGTIFQIPGILFYTTALLVFGSFTGMLVAYIGSVLAVIGSFYFARNMGGNLLDRIGNAKIRKWLDRLESRPILAIGVMRSLFWVSPPLNYALAFSNIPVRKYVIGSTLGLIVPALVFGFGSDCLLPF